MATVHFTAKVKDSRLLELPEEAQELGLKPGDEIHIFLESNGATSSQALSDEDEQDRLRALSEKLFAEADAIERTPGTFSDPHKAQVSDMIAEKHRKMGMRV